MNIKINTKWALFAGLFALFVTFIGYERFWNIGENIGAALEESSAALRSDAPVRKTGDITIPGDGKEVLVILTGEFRKVIVPPGNELCADPVEKVDVGPYSTNAVKQLRSKSGRDEEVFFYYRPYGSDCITEGAYAPPHHIPPRLGSILAGAVFLYFIWLK